MYNLLKIQPNNKLQSNANLYVQTIKNKSPQTKSYQIAIGVVILKNRQTLH